MPEFRIAKEGRAKWVVRKHRPPNTWMPVWYAASQESAVQWVIKQLTEKINAYEAK